MYLNQNWKNKTARVEILKDGQKLTYTASQIIISNSVISFTDKNHIRYGFPVTFIRQLIEVKQ